MEIGQIILMTFDNIVETLFLTPWCVLIEALMEDHRLSFKYVYVQQCQALPGQFHYCTQPLSGGHTLGHWIGTWSQGCYGKVQKRLACASLELVRQLPIGHCAFPSECLGVPPNKRLDHLLAKICIWWSTLLFFHQTNHTITVTPGGYGHIITVCLIFQCQNSL